MCFVVLFVVMQRHFKLEIWKSSLRAFAEIFSENIYYTNWTEGFRSSCFQLNLIRIQLKNDKSFNLEN